MTDTNMGTINLAPLVINGQSFGGGSINLSTPNFAALDVQAMQYAGSANAAGIALVQQTTGQANTSLNALSGSFLQDVGSIVGTQQAQAPAQLSTLDSLVSQMITSNATITQAALAADSAASNASIASSNASSGGGGCYLTTAVCKIRGESDDCQALNALRKMRDELVKTDTGKQLVEHYYRTAPRILARMRRLQTEQTRMLLIYIDAVIQVCVKLGQAGRLNDAARLYARMCTRLERICGVS